MDMEDRLNETDQRLIEIWAQEFDYVFNEVRHLTNSDLHAWFVVGKLLRYWRDEDIREGGSAKKVNEVQMKKFKKHGIQNLSDLSEVQAATLLAEIPDATEEFY